jgi:transmembrane sensor
MTDRAAIEREAAAWLLRQQEPDWSDADGLELEEWQALSDDHAAAFWRLEFGYAQFDRLRSLPEIQRKPTGWRVGWMPARRWALAACLAASVLLGAALVFRDLPAPAAEFTTFSTQPGQVAKVELDDGTMLSLDTNSKVRVAAGGQGRKVLLDRGDAYLEVAHDRAHPFIVQAGVGRITVLGTKFLVSRDGEGVRVAVLDGRVRLEPTGRESTRLATVGAGEVGQTDGRYVSVKTIAIEDIKRSLAWRAGMIVFADTRIADAAHAFNRYNETKIVVADQRAGDVRIGGSFRLGNVQGFARLLQENYGLRAADQDDTIVISSRQGTDP